MRDEIRREMGENNTLNKRSATVNSLLMPPEDTRNQSILSAQRDSWQFKDLIKQNA